MPSLNLDLVSFLIGLFLLVVGLLYAIALFIPSLGKRIYGKFWPNSFTEPAQRRAAYLRALAFIGCFLCFGLQFFLRQIKNRVCEAQDTLELASVLMPMLAAVCLLLASIIQKRSGIDQIIIPKDTKKSKLITLVVSAFAIAPLLFLFFAIRNFSNHTFEPLERVQMVSPTEGWAIGNVGFGGVIYHYHNGDWKKEAIPPVGLLTDISMLSPSEGWVVSNDNTMLHYKNGAWLSIPSPIGELTGIDMIASDEGWAVGNFGNILHYSQGRWTKFASPTTKALEGVSMVSATEGWAVGGGDYASPEASVILHYQNGIWKLADNPLKAPLNRIHMSSANEGWAVGGSRFNPTTSVILHYQNGNWRQEPSPVDIPLTDISMASALEGWAVGGEFFRVPHTCQGASQTVEMNVLLHYANGTWTQVSSPTDRALRGVSMIDKNTGLIVGWNTFLRYVQGMWQEVQPEA
jgi:hypothetical protein